MSKKSGGMKKDCVTETSKPDMGKKPEQSKDAKSALKTTLGRANTKKK